MELEFINTLNNVKIKEDDNVVKNNELEIIPQIREGRQYNSTASLKRKTAENIIETLFLDLNLLWILYNENKTRNFAIRYARDAMKYGGFKNFILSANDLYHGLHILITKDTSKLKSGKIDIKTNEYNIKELLNNIKNDKLTKNIYNRIMMRISQDLKISAYNKTIMRNVVNINDIGPEQKNAIFIRLSQYYRSKSKRNDLYLKLLTIKNKKSIVSKIGNIAAAGAAAYSGFQIGRNLVKKLV